MSETNQQIIERLTAERDQLRSLVEQQKEGVYCSFGMQYAKDTKTGRMQKTGKVDENKITLHVGTGFPVTHTRSKWSTIEREIGTVNSFMSANPLASPSLDDDEE